MFGYVKINKKDLTFREYEHYKGYYCGVCKYLKRNHTELSRMTLNYDITFLVLLLTSLYEPKAQITYEKCMSSPFKKNKTIINEVTEYAASMNILLAYYKLLDNVIDENGVKDKFLCYAFKKSFKTADIKYPKKSEHIKVCLEELHKLEDEKCYNIDKTSNCFGKLMSELFVYKDDKYIETLKKIGFNIGKYIYIIDAYEDLEDDVKKNRYNPFLDYNSKTEELTKKVDRIIGFTLANLERAIRSLNINVNNAIIENIIYSGVYLRYKDVLYGKREETIKEI